jgi:tripartite-type tricarboxylate transporter receptor subunit TctC
MRGIVPPLLIAAILFPLAHDASAADASFPRMPVRIIVPLPPGGGVDAVIRLVAPRLSARWGQPVMVENHVGDGGATGTALVSAAAGDGHTLLASSSAHVASGALRTGLRYDPLEDFVPVAPLSSQGYVLVVGKQFGARDLAEFISRAKEKPGTLRFTSAGPGSGPHLMAEKFNLDAGITMIHAPSAGGTAANEEVAAGRAAYWFSSATPAMPFIRDGRLVALGVSGPKRMAALPAVPTVAEAGVPGFAATLWYGVWAPKATSREVVERIAGDIAAVIGSDEVREQLVKAGSDPMTMSPPEFDRFVRSEAESALRVVKAAGIRPQ